jgi:AraC-like DNA-binding protein
LLIRISNLIEQRTRLQEHYRKSFHLFSTAPITEESADSAFLTRVRQAIENHLETENFNVSELAHEIGMSRSQLHRKLSALTGHSPNEIIRNMRLERAHALLKNKVGTAAEIAYQTGFSSPSYFAKRFKEYFGISPSEI